MGLYTTLDDPYVDEVIGSHMQRIVAAIRSGMEPDAILLRGSFGKAEGNVLVQDGQLKFLSDYEINVSTLSYRYRSLFAKLAERLTTELGVQTSVTWMRPDYFEKLRVGPFVAGPVPITISLYETRYGSRILYGRDLLRTARPIDAGCISLASGLQLILNRMAEALGHLPGPDGQIDNEWQSIHWLNKLMLACVESLLLSWGQYHYSYLERGTRFSVLAKGRLGFMGDNAPILYRFAERATQFRLRPERDLYPASLQETSYQVISICDRVFFHLAAREWGSLLENSYARYPERYLQVQARLFAPFSYVRALYKLLDVYKYGRRNCLPLNILSPNTASEVVYSIVPLLFVGWAGSGETLSAILEVVRQELRKLCRLEPPAPDPRDEWRQLSKRMLVLWKNFCT